MSKDINIKIVTKSGSCISKTVPYGTKTFQIFADNGLLDIDIYAVKINNEICPMDFPLEYNATIEPVMNTSKEGSSIYRRSLCLLLATAAHELFPDRRLIVGHSIASGYFYTFDGMKECSQETIDAIKKKMMELVSKDLLITTETVSYSDAAKLFERLNLRETKRQLNYISNPSIKINSIGNFSDMYFGPLALSTGVLRVFDLLKYQEGFLLRFPRTSNPNVLPEFKDQPMLYQVFKHYKEWGKRLNVTSAAALNELVANRKIKDFIDITETYQQKNISNIATQIAQKGTVRIVLIAGPSSSGKTTSAKKLGLELQAMGYLPKIISLDDYYIGRDKTPLDENGKPDFECLEALNVELLNQNLMDLFDGKEVNIPSYNFTTGTSFFEEKKKMTLAKNEILIMEGIHGLNDRLTPKVPAELKFKIYLSALTQLNLDDHNRISTSDNRLIRRIVRDYNFRGKSAEGTIAMWPSVKRGAELHIFPFQNNADAVLNTALDYELPVLRVYAAPLLRRVTPEMPEYGEARRLLSFLENFATIAPTEVPDRSIIREFIGGSKFHY